MEKEQALKVLIDTNVAITFLTKREDPFAKKSAEIMFLCGEKKIKGFLAFQ